MATSKLTSFKGGAELQKFLDTLPTNIERNIMRSALRQGANVIRDDARSRAPVEDGDLRKSIKVKTRSRRGRVSASVVAGDNKAFYAHMIEFGVAPHGVKKGAKRKSGKYQDGTLHPGFSEMPFMRPAADAKTGDAVVAVGNQIRKRLTKEGINAPAGLEVDDE